MKILIMLTKVYPFGSGESFIENEIDVFGKKFDKILLIACTVDKDVLKSRSVPENVKIVRIENKGKLHDIIHSLHYFIKPSKTMASDIKENRGVLKRAFACYFEYKSERIYKNIKEHLNLAEIKNENITIYSYWLFVTARVGVYLKNDLKNAVKYMFTRAHRYDLYADRNRLGYIPARKFLLDNYDKVYPCSVNGTKYLCERYPEYKDKITTSFLGTIDYGVERHSQDDVFRIVSCSRIVDVKRVDKIIDALTLLDNGSYKIEWTHIGGGTLEKKIEIRAKEHLKNIKYCITGEIQNADVIQLYCRSSFDLFLNVSSSEGLPVSIMEAMSFGIPTIATDVGGTGEIVISEENGYLIPADFDSNMLKEKIELLISDRDSCVEMGKRARKIWEEKFQAINNYEQLCIDIAENIK